LLYESALADMVSFMEPTVEILKGLADEIRLRILGLLLEEKELCVCDLINFLQLPQSTISRHLSTLKKCGWIADRKKGVWSYYRLSPELSPLFRSLLLSLQWHLPCLEAVRADRERMDRIGFGKTCHSAEDSSCKADAIGEK
jgi:ArsR family transcriptional regulator, arsenate/arsenite/antimonite-responsive transcriptional repressor